MSKLFKFYQTNIPCPKHPTVLLEVRCPAYGSSSDYVLVCDECALDAFLRTSSNEIGIATGP